MFNGIVVTTLLFSVLLKIIERAPVSKLKDPILDAILSDILIEKFKVWHEVQPHLKEPTETFIYKVYQYQAYQKFLTTLLKNEVNNLSNNN